MKTTLEIFDEWTTTDSVDLSPRYHPIPDEIAWPFDEQRKTFSKRLSSLEKMFLVGKKVEIYMDFLDDGDCNAVADAYGGIGLVGISKGAILLPFDTFFRMLSHPSVLQDVGNNNAEQQNIFHGDGLLDNYNELVS